MTFTSALQTKIDLLKERRTPIKLGRMHFSSALIQAPMSGISSYPFRLLMEDLGAGGTVSELVSCHGINHGNHRTRQMLRIHPREQNVGLQLFGEDADAMAQAAQVAQEFGPQFIDINMGCPVRKVVTKGGGSALLRDPQALPHFFKSIAAAIKVPLTIKIRTGWDASERNADEVIRIAQDAGIEMVAIHGRTRTQQYQGQADWQYLEELSASSPLPLVGNGDLHSPQQVRDRLQTTKCSALMIARGSIRNPFIFLESFLAEGEAPFQAQDYWEILQRLYTYNTEAFEQERMILVQMRKFAVWFATGFHNASHFRDKAFPCQSLSDLMKLTEDYFLSLAARTKQLDHKKTFMAGGHG